MITDLERNDLGRVCEYGSVTVPDLLRPEKFAQVHHLVSTVTGQLRRDVSPLQALRACFPGGSITGAPKKTAMEWIQRLEPCPRGLYTGAIGLLCLQWRRRLQHRPIRTLVRDGECAALPRGRRHHGRFRTRPRIRRDHAKRDGAKAGCFGLSWILLCHRRRRKGDLQSAMTRDE